MLAIAEMATTGKLNILFDNETVTTSELLGIIKLVNIGLGLAYLDLIQCENKLKYESLKHSFCTYLYSRNKEIMKSFFEAFSPASNSADEDIIKRITKLKNQFRYQLDEPIFRELIALLETIYLEKLFRKYDYSERNLQRSVVSALVKSEIVEKRQFNLNDFSEWLSIDSENRVSDIRVAEAQGGHEYEIKFLLVPNVENNELNRRQTLLTLNYIVELFSNQNQMPIRKLSVPKMPDNLTSIVAQYDKVFLDINNHTMTLELRINR
jgi:hypothetical protein